MAAEAEGDRLTTDELLTMCALLFAADFETTTNLLGNSLMAFLAHPEALAQLGARPELMPGSLRRVEDLDPKWIVPNHYDVLDGDLHKRRFVELCRKTLG